jgi:hypothetical protein
LSKYTDNHETLSGIDRDVFVLDSTTISVSIILMDWAHGKYSRGAVKMHTLLNLRGNIPTFIHITDGKYHDVNALDEIDVVAGAVYKQPEVQGRRIQESRQVHRVEM